MILLKVNYLLLKKIKIILKNLDPSLNLKIRIVS